MEREESFFGEPKTDDHSFSFSGRHLPTLGVGWKIRLGKGKERNFLRERNQPNLVVTQGWNQVQVLKTHGWFSPREILLQIYRWRVCKGKKLNSKPLKGRIQFPVVAQSWGDIDSPLSIKSPEVYTRNTKTARDGLSLTKTETQDPT